MRWFYCRAYCSFVGPVGDFIRASSATRAAVLFFQKHALHPASVRRMAP